ncbi:MAG: 4-hydroxy-tetrahydrodipicolinate synthase [Myxococcota bacterium]
MNGILTALVTPFDEDQRLDVATFEAQCRRQIDAGIHGLVPCGTTGETPTLSDEEWETVVRTAVRTSAGTVPVLAGVGTNNTRSTVAFCERAQTCGASHGLLVLPYYNKPNPDGLREHVRQAINVGLPLMLYHVPHRTGQHVPAPLLAELASMDGIVAVKEATGDLRYGTELITATQTAILSGDDFSFLGLLAQGGTGCVSVVSNVVPAATVAVFNAWERGDHAEAIRRFQALFPLMTWLMEVSNPIHAKAALAVLGFGGPTTRPPLVGRSDDLPVTRVRALVDAAESAEP